MIDPDDITAELVRDLLAYDPEVGHFQWKHRPEKYFPNSKAYASWNGRWAGTKAGNRDSKGYSQIRILGRLCLAHRLACLYQYEEWPDGQVDHINGDRLDNRILNLRTVSQSANQKNSTLRKDNTSGVPGVFWNKILQRWTAYVATPAGYKYVASSKSYDFVVSARKAAELVHGYSARHGSDPS